MDIFSTPDIADENPHVRALAPILKNLGGKKSFFGKIQTVKCPDDNSLIKEESSSVKFENAMQYIEEEKYSKAIDELEYLLLVDPLSDFANDAQYYVAESYYNLNNYRSFVEQCIILVKN